MPTKRKHLIVTIDGVYELPPMEYTLSSRGTKWTLKKNTKIQSEAGIGFGKFKVGQIWVSESGTVIRILYICPLHMITLNLGSEEPEIWELDGSYRPRGDWEGPDCLFALLESPPVIEYGYQFLGPLKECTLFYREKGKKKWKKLNNTLYVGEIHE